MTILFLILIILASVILGFIILVQNPKGGGLSSSIGGLGNQFMGVKQTTDVLEKGTWLFAGIIGLLCLVSVLFMGGAGSDTKTNIDRLNTGGAATQQPKTQPATPAATTTAPTTADSSK